MHKLTTGLALAGALISASPAQAADATACWLRDAKGISHMLQTDGMTHLSRAELKQTRAKEIIINGRRQLACVVDWVSMSMQSAHSIHADKIRAMLQTGIQEAPSGVDREIPVDRILPIVRKELPDGKIEIIFGVQCIIAEGRIGIAAVQAGATPECQ